VLTDYKGLTVSEISEMRRLLKESSIEYRVVKNTLARIAAEDTPVAVVKDEFVGPVGVAVSYDDPVELAKKVIDYNKKNEKFAIKCGVIEGKFVDLEGLKNVSKLPSREVLLAMFAGALSSPIRNMASLLQATIVKLGYALNALKEKKSAEG
jgi:large subunit ribosomal protein L10